MLIRNRFLGGVSSFALFAPEMGAGTGEPAPAAPAITPSVTVEGPTTPRAAATLLSDWREKQAKAASEPEKKAEQPREKGRFVSAAAPVESPLEGADASPDIDPVPGETAQDDPAELPPIDPPRSWSKEDKELFNSLPRETQERVADRERSRESDFLRRQNEAADKSKALQAKEQAAEQARQQYEQAAQNALRLLNNQIASEFADIKTQDDVIRLANEDPFRAIQFQARRDQLMAMHQEVQANEQRAAQEKEQTFKAWAQEQDDKFAKQFPEFADKSKAAEISSKLGRYLVDEVGVPEDALSKLKSNEVFRDAMFQRVLYDGYRFHAAQQAAKTAVQKPVPPVQRPGTAPQRGAGLQEEIAAATDRLKNATGIAAIRAAADLQAARRKAAPRR